ncbi:MAG TPA: ArsR family transcriptional regulator [Chryseosolibacter sp.]
MLEHIITSRTRLKMLLKFFLNSHSKAHLRGLADEFGESTNSIRHELMNLSKAGYLVSSGKGNIIEYSANVHHPLYPELQKLVHKYLGIDKITDNIINMILARMGELELGLITGDYANGKDTGIIDLVLVGTIDLKYTNTLVSKAEKLISRKIRVLVLTKDEFEKNKKSLNPDKALCLWRKD